MQVRRLHHLDEFTRPAADWNRLDGGVPFRSFEWLATWWQHYQPVMTAARRHVELYLLSVTDGERLVGLAPWYLERSHAHGRIVRFLGSGEVCSDYLSVLCQADRRADVAESLADWLMRSTGLSSGHDDRWDILELTGTDAQDSAAPLLADRLESRGAGVHARVCDHTWRIELPDSWDGYLGLLSKSHRKQLRQLERRVFDSGVAVLRTVGAADELETGWQILARLHQRRLQSLGKPGCFESESFSQFHRAATDALYRAGRLRLHWLELAGRPIAAEFHLTGDDMVFAYQGGIEPNALKREPGRLITLATLERAIAGGYRAFDFCRGDEPYKAHWRAMPRESIEWRIVCDRSSARLRHRVWTARHSAREWVKRNLNAAHD